MGSITTNGFSVANLVQNLTGAGSPQLAATLSSPAVQTAIQNAPASDLVDLSSQALKLQETDQLFGDGSATPSAADTATLASTLYPLSTLLAAADAAANKAPGSGAPSPSLTASSSATSLASQLAEYQGDSLAEEMQTLFGIAPTASPPSSLFDALG
jgi:hypothetical protein